MTGHVNMPYFTCGERIVDVVKGNGIDGVNLLNVIFFQSVTLEGVLLLLHLRARVQVLNCHSAFNRAQYITLPRGNQGKPKMVNSASRNKALIPKSNPRYRKIVSERKTKYGQVLTKCLSCTRIVITIPKF